jgi:3-oxoacyl-[acyl-carrier protein] reductase
MSEDDWATVIDINLTGTFAVCKPVAFSMMKRSTGSIILMSSVGGVYGNATQANYAASKAGIIGLSSPCQRACPRGVA